MPFALLKNRQIYFHFNFVQIILGFLIIHLSTSDNPLFSAFTAEHEDRELCGSSNKVCFNDGICFVNRTEEGTEFYCECRDGFDGLLCELNCRLRCQNGAKCRNTVEKGEWCECQKGFRGPLCAERIGKMPDPEPPEADADCRERGCPFAHVCLPETRSETQTEEHPERLRCEWDLCVRWGQSPCSNNATCVPLKNDFRCECPPGFRGRQCVEDVNECAEAEVNPCHNFGKCVNTPGAFWCRCQPGWTGTRCELQASACERNPCGEHGICHDADDDAKNGTRAYTCDCFGNFTGDHCDTDCRHPRVIVTEAESGRRECACPADKTGDNCELTATDCNRKDDAQSQCQNGGQCVPAGAKAFCICPTGFSGVRCEHAETTTAVTASSTSHAPAEEPCTVKGRACLNGGRCIRRKGGATQCKCTGQFIGVWCDRPLRLSAKTQQHANVTTGEDPCVPNPCQNGGQCSVKDNGPLCKCPFGVSAGKTCELKCHCSSDEGCAEVQPGKAECFRNISTTRLTTTRTTIVASSETGFASAEEDDEAEQDRFNVPFLPDLEHNDTLGTAAPLTNVSSCDQCANGAKCVTVGDRLQCLCTADFMGPLCDVKQQLCAGISCSKPGEQCLLVRNIPGHPDRARCGCPLGTGGKRCATQNVLSMSNVSAVLLQQQQGRRKTASTEDYHLSIGIRTSLANAHLATGESVLGQTEFTLWLRDGFVLLQLGGDNGTMETHTFDAAPVRVNDADWWQLTLWSTRKHGTGMQLWDAESGYLLARRLLSSTQRLVSVWTTRLGKHREGAHFIGCMRDLKLNGGEPIGADDERSVGVLPGCVRMPQCTAPTPCANGGQCVDLWDRFECHCSRPFLAPKCREQAQEATFGHGQRPTKILYALSAEDQSSIIQKTSISFLLRTARPRGAVAANSSAPMALFRLGDTTDPETSTFVAAELQAGVPRIRVRLGGKQVYSMQNTSGTRLDDGHPHLVELDRDGNRLTLRLDGRLADAPLVIDRPFAHPLLADQLLIGDVPEFPTGGSAFSNGTMHFRGTLQDFRVNNRFVPFTDNPEEEHGLELFEHKLSDQNLLQGTVSDDVCDTLIDQKPCGSHGQCENTFNDFECRCHSGWMGPTCRQRDFCRTQDSNNGTRAQQMCPKGTDECQNTADGFVCLSTVSLFTTSALRYAVGNSGKSTPKSAGNFSLELLTRTRNGHVLKLQHPAASLVLQLRNGILQLHTSNGHNAAFLGLNVTDGQWHHILLRQTADGHGLRIDVDASGNADAVDSDTDTARANFSLTNFAADRMARISVGRVADQNGVKGCLRNLRLDGVTPLMFHTAQELPPEASAQFVLQRRENVNPGRQGCRSPDLCAKNPCLNSGTCEDLFHDWRCKCTTGFEGEQCEINRDECALQGGDAECAPNGRCVDEVNGFRCQCATGFSGPKCTKAEELCKPDTCKNRGKCRTLNGTVECTCGPKYIGAWCQLDAGTKCSEQPCQNGGQCHQSDHGEIGCWCRPGFAGPLCELRVDPCRSFPCQNGAKCVPVPNSVLSNAETSAISTTPRLPPFQCECAREFEGPLCERLADTCTRLGPAACTWHGHCENVWGGHICACEQGWRGRNCSVPIDACAEEAPCVNGGTCVSDPHVRAGFHCRCAPFYSGERCEQASVCADNPCQNGGECVPTSDADASTDADVAAFSCKCAPGFRGPTCTERVDPCSQEPCVNGGTCVTSDTNAEDFRCQCIAGFTGKHCEQDVDECVAQASACLNGGRCSDRVNGIHCDCSGTGYRGARCELDLDECARELQQKYCQNGVNCTNIPGGYNCTCKPGYLGSRCSMPDPCVPNPLTNRSMHQCAHGKCVRPRVGTTASGTEFVQHDCECAPGFTGELCMHLMEPQHALSMSNFIGAGVVLLVLCICLAALLYFFVACTRRKRANQGTYSPSTQEMTARTRFQRQHNQQLLFSNTHHHKPRRKR